MATQPLLNPRPDERQPLDGGPTFDSRRTVDGGRDRLAGVMLVLVGALLLLAYAFPGLDLGRLVVLLVGLACLGAFLNNRAIGFLIPGGILTGLGLGIAVESSFRGGAGSGAVLWCLGGGFIAIYALGALLNVRGHHWWPLVPGVVLTLVGSAVAAGPVGVAVLEFVGRLWPVVLIAAGGWLILRGTNRRPF